MISDQAPNGIARESRCSALRIGTIAARYHNVRERPVAIQSTTIFKVVLQG